MILFKRLHRISLEYCVAGHAAGGARTKTNSTISQFIDVPIIFIFLHIYGEILKKIRIYKLRSKWKQLYLGGTVGGKVLHIRVPHLWNEVSVIPLSHSYFMKLISKCGDYYLAGISHHLQEHHNLFMCTTNTDVRLLWSDCFQSRGELSHIRIVANRRSI